MIDDPAIRAGGESNGERERRPRRRSGGVTLREVARLAGVAMITASRAINTPDQVSAATLARVREAVETTGYVPNMLAGGLASTRSRLIAAVVPTIVGPVFLETIQSLTESLAAAGYQLMLGQSGYDGSREDALLDAIIGRRPDGIILTGIMHSEEGRRRLLASGIPVIETWDLTPNPIDMLIGFSHEKIGPAVVEHLLARGRRHLAALTADDERALRRKSGFVDAARAKGLTSSGLDGLPTGIVRAPTTLGSGRTGLIDLLARHPDIDAIFCSSDLLALGVLIEAQMQGIPVPRRLAVVGFGDLAFARDLNPALTTVRIDGTSIGRLAARLIVDRAEGRPVNDRVVDVGFSIIPRAST
ncbi:MAG: LacI family DNA-binding transcriptional regulator [Betaproteobacteria bacterium]|nr:LacI family DNA-binding transcriptional regulator [Betaproteobacteria bacterium]